MSICTYKTLLPVFPSDSYDKRFRALVEAIDKSKKVVFFGGAGVSTASGIPDFRSADGLYNKEIDGLDKDKPVEYYLSKECLYNKPKDFFTFVRNYLDCRAAEPNIVHKTLAGLEKQRRTLKDYINNTPTHEVTIITQNIDMLHEKAGSTNIINLHGSFNQAYCCKCGKSCDDVSYIFNEKPLPKCSECGGIIRPDVVLYGETIQHYAEAEEAISNADCMIIAGTSLTVYPAAALVSEFKGKYLIIINNSETNLDNYADIIFRESVEKIFSDLAGNYHID